LCFIQCYFDNNDVRYFEGSSPRAVDFRNAFSVEIKILLLDHHALIVTPGLSLTESGAKSADGFG